jgi:hypothetical protein
MSRDSVLSVYSDARAEYTKQLSVFLVPAYFQFYIELLEKSKQAMIQEPKRVLWQFQNYLNEIHDWNMEKVNQEIHAIQHNSGCDYLEDLLTAVFIAHTKVLTAIRLSSNNKKVEINIPKVEHFLFKALCETSKLLWSSTYLFRDGIPGMEKQQNYRNIEGILHEGILQAVRGMVPVKSILRDFVNHDSAQDEPKDQEEAKDESDEEPEPKPEPKSEPKPELKPEHTDTPPIVTLDTPALTSVSDNTPTSPAEPQTIHLDEKPTVRFGLFDAIFDSDHPSESDMIYEPKDADDGKEDNVPSESIPVLEIMEEEGTPLENEPDMESLDGIQTLSEDISSEDYEVLS